MTAKTAREIIPTVPRAARFFKMTHYLLSPAQDSDTARPLGRMFLSFPRACLARARNPELRWRTWGRTGILRAAATRENDRARDRARLELSL
jgi:hypothetical protein